jgi:hypothetical protein
MSHFAQVKDGIVVNVIVAEQDFIDTLPDAEDWVQTSYNTHGGINLKGGTALRKNYASIGMIYDAQRDAFYAPSPFKSWLLNEESCLWESPVAIPDDKKMYKWDEAKLVWNEIKEITPA